MQRTVAGRIWRDARCHGPIAGDGNVRVSMFMRESLHGLDDLRTRKNDAAKREAGEGQE